MRRRDFLAASGLAALATSLPTAVAAFGSSGRKLEKIGFQLYTAREQMAADSAATLATLAEIGYDEVEFAGYHEHPAARVRAMLDATGLEAPSAHVPLELIRSAPERLIEAASTVGHSYLVLAWLAPPERERLDQYKGHAELCNQFAEQCRSAGIQFAYHNHDFEFVELEGRLPMDLLLAETEADLVKVELDLYWTTLAGADPFEYFANHEGRFPLCHVKDMAADGSMVDAGSGTIDFAAIFARSGQAGLTHYFVERDDSPDPMATAASAHTYLRSLEI